ncbi:hypothetical protein FA13DRAFT_1761907 [Coprinellus micaceus]|uniref:PHD-type domain-containing protein n=1 Tax=Coprinellus micaceus TaxID=71717 RepID=A0A4Y7TU11_COPMI|nr:hypothetical protein FA13DRAFT_1761907 [Coprinellus micaceus]
MGPPPSPRETRRSGRRSAPAASTSASKSPDSDQPPKLRDAPTRPALPSNAGGGRNKRLKQEDFEDGDDDRRNNPAPSVTSNGSAQGASNGKSKRKGKDKDKPAEEQVEEEATEPHAGEGEVAAGDEEEQGITRCVCGSTEDDPDAGEFMIQCEGCKVWQHGPCMGFMTEDQVDDDDYYCEQCKPELHTDLLKRLSSKTRRHHANAARVSRSRSPSQQKQQSKRRNTMNSRDFDESLKEVIEATAAEAARKDPSVHGKDEPTVPNDGDHDGEPLTAAKKKRKRTEDDAPSKKRTRSASTTSERQGSALPRDDTPLSGSMKPVSQAPTASKGGGRNKRGGRKNAADIANPVDGEEGASLTPAPSVNKRQGNTNRKGAGPKRPPLSHAVSSTGVSQEQSAGRARNPTGINQHSAANAEARAYRNSHAYAVSQQPLLTSWGLPDYLAHLEHMLPSDTPQPLEVRSTSNNPNAPRSDSTDMTMERGVKVKWPSKRMSVGDMNKRVRALVEWVGREQASALERERRREALEKELHEPPPLGMGDGTADVVMAINKESTSATMREMEELMEELIGFQERFGPGAKTRERERRQGV